MNNQPIAGSWGAELHGDAADLEHLASTLTGPALTVAKIENVYHLRSEYLDGIIECPRACEELDRLALVLSGLLKLLRFANTPLVCGQKYGLDASGTICSTVIPVPCGFASITVDYGDTFTVQTNP